MEEKEIKPTYEQLEGYIQQLQYKYAQAEAKLAAINYTAVRLEYLFKVLENREVFKAEFVEKCVSEVETILTVEEVETKE